MDSWYERNKERIKEHYAKNKELFHQKNLKRRRLCKDCNRNMTYNQRCRECYIKSEKTHRSNLRKKRIQ